MGRKIFATILGMAFLESISAVAAPKVVTLSMIWNVVIGTDGRISELSTKEQGLSDIRERIENEMRTWQFTPGERDGKLVPITSKLYLKFTLMPRGDKPAIRILSASTGGGYRTMVPVTYPRASLINGKQGLVLLGVGYDVDGKVEDLAPVPDAPEVDARLVEAALTAVRQWTFEPEIVGGHPISGAAFVPVCFGLNIPDGIRPNCSWRPPDSNVEQPGDHPMTIHPAAKLKNEVTGRTL